MIAALAELLEAGGTLLLEALEEEIGREGIVTVPVNSTALQNAAYDNAGRMTVQFHDGVAYEYAPGLVSFGEFLALITAPSAGSYYNRNIRGRGNPHV